MCFRNLALAALFLVAASATQAQELVTNGGFETGDLTGFTAGGGNFVTSNSVIVHSGAFGLEYIAVGSDSPLSQTLTTTPGDTETITFWQHQLNGTPNEVTLDFGGVRLLTLTDLPLGPWTEYTATAIATSNSTVLTLGLRQDPGASGIDDISVIQSAPLSTPEPGSIALLAGMGLSGAGFLARRRKNARKAA